MSGDLGQQLQPSPLYYSYPSLEGANILFLGHQALLDVSS